MGNDKRVGWFDDPKVCKHNASFFRFTFETDKSLPIVGNKLTRLNIYTDCWNYLAGPIADRFLTKEKQEEAGSWMFVHLAISALAELLAYPLSQKKISGLGSVTKATESVDLEDKVLRALKNSKRIIEDIVITEEHKKFNLGLVEEINELLNFHEKTIGNYVWVYKRENRFLQKWGESLDLLNGLGFENAEIKNMVYDALAFYEKRNFKRYVNFLDRLFKKDFYEIEHHDSFAPDGDPIESYSIRKRSKKLPTTPEN